MPEIEKLLEDINKKFEEQQKSGASKDELKALSDAISTLKTNSNEENEKLEKVLKTHGELLASYKKTSKEEILSEAKQINQFIDENLDEIKSAMQNGTFVTFEVKAAGTISRGNGTLVDNPAALGPLTDINLRKADLVKYADISETGRGQFSYSEATPKDGEAANVAEGTAKPQVDIEWKERFVKPTKVAAWMSLTEEALEDVIGIKSLVRNFLRKKHDIRVEADIYFGDGNGANSLGATKVASTFTAGSMAAKVVNPSLIDVVNACIVSIASKRNYVDEEPYIANVAFVSPVDFFLNFAAKKDSTGDPMYPNAHLFNEIKIGPTTIIPTFRMDDDKIFVADMKKYHVVKKKSYIVKIGLVNDDFIKNQRAILGESRYYAYVQNLDKVAFVYDSIAAILTAIKKP